MDNTERFTGKAEAYAKARPSYAPALFDYLAKALGVGKGSTVADIGCGTGIFTRALLATGAFVHGVEPNADMRAKAAQLLADAGNFRLVAAPAEDTRLAAGSVDLITAAQAFHWFDVERFRAECARILRPAGKVVLVWNAQEEGSAMVREYEALRRAFCPKFSGFSGGKRDGALIARFFVNGYELTRYPNPVGYAQEQFIQRNLSTSNALTPADSQYGAYIDALNALFEKHAEGGTLTMPYETVAYIGAIS